MKVVYKLYFKSIFKDKEPNIKYGKMFEDAYNIIDGSIDLTSDGWLHCAFIRNELKGVPLEQMDNDLIAFHQKFKHLFPNELMEVIIASHKNDIIIHLVDISDELIIEKFNFDDGYKAIYESEKAYA